MSLYSDSIYKKGDLVDRLQTNLRKFAGIQLGRNKVFLIFKIVILTIYEMSRERRLVISGLFTSMTILADHKGKLINRFVFKLSEVVKDKLNTNEDFFDDFNESIKEFENDPDGNPDVIFDSILEE